MSELGMCPFCDGEMKIGNYGATLRQLEIPSDDRFSISHVDEKLAIEKKCPLAIEFFNSKREAIEAWNTRTEREFRIVEYEIGGTRYIPERTCEIEDCYFEDEHHLHRAMDTDEWFGAFGMCSLCGEYIPVMNYCPNCGARVVGLWSR